MSRAFASAVLVVLYAMLLAFAYGGDWLERRIRNLPTRQNRPPSLRHRKETPE